MNIYQSEKRRWLLVFAPVLLMDIIIGVSNILRIGNMDLTAFFDILKDPYLFELPDMPHNFLILPILFLAAEIVWVLFLEKDSLFAKILAAKTVLFAILGYLPWYCFLMFDLASSMSFISYIQYVADILLIWYLIIANVIFVLAILMKAKKGKES